MRSKRAGSETFSIHPVVYTSYREGLGVSFAKLKTSVTVVRKLITELRYGRHQQARCRGTGQGNDARARDGHEPAQQGRSIKGRVGAQQRDGSWRQRATWEAIEGRSIHS